MAEAGELLGSLREDLGAEAAFAVGDLRRILAFDTAAALESHVDSLGDLAASQVSPAAEAPGHVTEADAGIMWELQSGQSIYVTRLSPGVVLVVLWREAVPDSPNGTSAARVYGTIRHTRARLAAALST